MAERMGNRLERRAAGGDPHGFRASWPEAVRPGRGGEAVEARAAAEPGTVWEGTALARVAALLATLAAFAAFGLTAAAGQADAAPSVALLQFNPEGAAENILDGFAMFIALVAIFVAVGRFARGAMMQGFGVLLGGGILFAIALAPKTLSEFGTWVLEQFGLGLIPPLF